MTLKIVNSNTNLSAKTNMLFSCFYFYFSFSPLFSAHTFSLFSSRRKVCFGWKRPGRMSMKWQKVCKNIDSLKENWLPLKMSCFFLFAFIVVFVCVRVLWQLLVYFDVFTNLHVCNRTEFMEITLWQNIDHQLCCREVTEKLSPLRTGTYCKDRKSRPIGFRGFEFRMISLKIAMIIKLFAIACLAQYRRVILFDIQ